MSTSFRVACEAASAVRNLPPPRLPEIPATTKVLQQLKALPETTRKPGTVDLNFVAREIAARLSARETLSRKQLRDAPWCLWQTRPALSEDAGLLEQLLRTISDAPSSRPFRTLATAFMSAYDENQAGRGSVAALLARLAEKWMGVWGFLQDTYSIFDLTEGPRRLALEVHASDRTPVDILRAAGLAAMDAEGGFTKAVVAALMTELAEGVEPDHRARLEKVKRFSLRPDGQPLFGDQRYEIVDALLRPFVKQHPDEGIQDEFLKVVVATFSDPRLRPGQWVGLPHRDVVVSWLTRQSLRQFLDIVDQTAVERMWKYRRAFWEGLYEYCRRRDVAVEAWVAFGPRGEQLARRSFGKHSSFARLYKEGRQVEDGHAVLLFKIADCVIADWSHRGRCNIWTSASDRNAPRLYQSEYGSDRVRISEATGNLKTDALFCIAHVAPENYNWQDQVAARLYELTGLRFPRAAYKL